MYVLVRSISDRIFLYVLRAVSLVYRTLVDLCQNLTLPSAGSPPLHPHLRHLFGRIAADPTADVEGFDVQAKIALLTKLAFGATVPSDLVRRRTKAGGVRG